MGVPAALWAIGTSIVFGRIIFSGLRWTFFGLADIRLINYVLENSYRWLAGYPLHADLWSPPIFYPHREVGAYTDPLLAVAPPYWGFRVAGLEPDVAFLAWMLLIWTINFVVAYAVLRRVFGFGLFGGSVGAFLFAYGNPRSADIFHQQLVPGFYLLVALAALTVVFCEDATARRRRAWIVLFFAALVLQAHTAFYPLFFFALALAVALLWAIALADFRRPLAIVARRDGSAILLAGVVALALLAPLLSHYVAAAREVGLRAYPEASIPRLASWLLTGPRHPWYGWLQQSGGPFFELRATHHSHGVGLATTLVALAGLALAWRRRSVRLMLLAVGTLIVATTRFPGGFTGWLYAYDYLPGAAAIRAVGRIGFLLLFPLALGVAAAVDHLAGKRRFLWLLPLAALIVTEQYQEIQYRRRLPVRSYIAELGEQLDPGCVAFLLVSRGPRVYPWVHDDAAWVSLLTEIPTLNGRYGNLPPGYPLFDVHIANRRDREVVERAFASWIARNDLPRPRVCWIETPGIR